MVTLSTDAAVAEIRRAAHPLTGVRSDLDPLLDLVGNARFVLLGEASHGTHEFYALRAEITKRLIEEKGFLGVAAEADWPDAYRVNRYVRGRSEDTTADQALSGFRRFPHWMWRNTVVRDFVEWLCAHNQGVAAEAGRAGFYGLDLYSLHTSIEAVLAYLERVDAGAARRARARYACFDHFGEDSQAYGYVASFDISQACENEVVAQLVELQRHAAAYAHLDGRVAADEYFSAEQNARLARNAEQYYRTMFTGRVSSWNLRDKHMAETLDALVAHLDKHGPPARLVLWAHNSHLGDARATGMGESGELNLGQLVRERYGTQAMLVGFTTYTGTVTAASEWDGPAERKRVRPALPGSYEALLHDTGVPRFQVTLHDDSSLSAALRGPRLERAIGVIYRPQTERLSHYFTARLSDQFDAVVHLDETRALVPLERTPTWETGEPSETFPTAL